MKIERNILLFFFFLILVSQILAVCDHLPAIDIHDKCHTHVGTKPAHLMFIDSKSYIGCASFKAVWEGLVLASAYVCAPVCHSCVCACGWCLFVSHKKQISENTEVK